MIGQKIHHYQITEKLGEGGMGVVYKAYDTRLHRTVALKFLNPLIMDSPLEQERLVNEARAAAGLSHPNICTIYEINESEGQTFIAMAYVEGSTLRDRVLSDRIAVHEALRYLIQIADGLKQAHARDIVHRDIKSANIMLNTTGQAIIMDFGLARRTGPPRRDERFSSGGTSAYMAPEQARGERVDQRTDIWSLGVVLYEMLAGQLPFRGDYEQAVIYSILNEPPRPVEELRPDTPPEVIEIVETCLAKSPDDRFQSLDELIARVRAVLDRVTGGSRDGSRPASRVRPLGIAVAAILTLVASFLVYDFIHGQMAGSEVRVPIAVIDFNNETGEEALDGLSGMLITALEQSRRLSVMTRTRMFDVLKRQGRDDVERIGESLGQEICRSAGVGALVIPSIRKFGDLYTIDLKVLDTRNNEYIFTTREEGQGQESIPEMIDRIARDIRVDLKEGSEHVAQTANLADVTTVNLDAYQQYFEGERYLNDLDFKKAHASFERAVELDSTFALAYYRLAYTEWWLRGQLGSAAEHADVAMANIDRIPEKERYLVRALEAGINEGFAAQTPIYKEMRALYPEDKEMLFGLGDSEFHSMNYDSALVHFKQVLEIDPEFDRALQHLTWTYMRKDRFDDAAAMAKRWVDVAGTAEAYDYLAITQYMTKDVDGAFATLEHALELHPDDFMIRQSRALLDLSVGKPDEAISRLQTVMETDTSSSARIYAVRTLVEHVYPYLGRFRDAERLYEGVGDLVARGEVDSTSYLMTCLTRAGLEYWRHGNMKKGLAIAEKTLDFPDHLKNDSYWKNLAAVYILAGQEDRAVEIFDTRVHDMLDGERDLYEVFRHSIAGRCDDAVALADTALGELELERAPRILYALGRCLVAAGRYDEAIARLEPLTARIRILLGGASVTAPVYICLGEAYEGVGEAGKAVDSYEKALAIWKDADEGLPLRVEASERLAALRAARNL